jgi:hypothetical protein
MSLALADLRQQLAAVIAGTPSSAPGLATGIAALDGVLPGHGIPRGRITELLAPAGLGKTTLARSLAAATLTAGHSVAWIDATRTLDPRDWVAVDAGRADALWVVRPSAPARASWCADLLLRAGSFALVVLDGAPVLPRAVAVRLAQLARDSDAALLLLGEGTRASEIGGALRVVLKKNESRRGAAGVTATIEKGGPHQHVPLQLLEIGRGNTVGIARRVHSHPEVPDRRGVAQGRSRRARR